MLLLLLLLFLLDYSCEWIGSCFWLWFFLYAWFRFYGLFFFNFCLRGRWHFGLSAWNWRLGLSLTWGFFLPGIGVFRLFGAVIIEIVIEFIRFDLNGKLVVRLILWRVWNLIVEIWAAIARSISGSCWLAAAGGLFVAAVVMRGGRFGWWWSCKRVTRLLNEWIWEIQQIV